MEREYYLLGRKRFETHKVFFYSLSSSSIVIIKKSECGRQSDTFKCNASL